MIELEIGSPDYTTLPPFLSCFKNKEVAEQIEVGSDTEKGFTEMVEGRNMKNRIGIEVD